jgi:hypothetical protein
VIYFLVGTSLFVSFFIRPFSLFLWLSLLLPFPLFLFGFFIALHLPLLFHACFVSVFFSSCGFHL